MLVVVCPPECYPWRAPVAVADIGRLKAEVERLLNCEGVPKTWLRVGQDTCCEMWNGELVCHSVRYL